MNRKFIIWMTLILTVSVRASWPTYHGDSGLRGVAEVSLPERPERLWRADAGGDIYNTPVSDGKRIFVAAGKGQIAALDLNGSNVWKKSFTRTNDGGQEMAIRFDAPLAVFNGTVFGGSSRGVLYALDSASGKEKWRYDTGGVLTGSPNRSSGQLMLLDQSEGALHAVNMTAGTRVWKTDGVERCDGTPGVWEGRVVFGSCLAELHVYATDGRHLADIEVEGDSQVAGGVALDGGLVFFGARDGRLSCADLEAGTLLWSSEESEEQTFSTPAVTKDRVVYSSDNGFVYAVERATGTTIWSFNTGGLPTSPVVAGDKVAVSSDGILYLLDLKKGRKLWSQGISDEISSPALINGMVVVGADDGTVSAFGEKK